MGRKNQDETVVRERRRLLCAGGLGALGLLTAGFSSRDCMAADIQYNKADVARVNRKLRSSKAERNAFYADPQGYLKRNHIHLPPDMIPSRKEVEDALKVEQGKTSMVMPSSHGGQYAGIVVSGMGKPAALPARQHLQRK